jgi:putative membrane protein
MHCWDYSYGPWAGMMYLGMIIFLLFAAILVYLFLQRFPLHRGMTPSETPLDILKRRYARGEITREQFEQMRRDIEG